MLTQNVTRRHRGAFLDLFCWWVLLIGWCLFREFAADQLKFGSRAGGLGVDFLFCQKYVKNTGIGTLVSLMLPYSLVFITCWTLFLIVYWLLGIPLGLQAAYVYPFIG